MKCLQNGDWVQGRTINGEFFRGYIEAVNDKNYTAIIRVVKCDNKKAVGKAAITLVKQIKYIEVEDFQEEGHLLNLIDLSLLTKDKEWFIELTDTLKKMQNLSSSKQTVFSRSNPLRTSDKR